MTCKNCAYRCYAVALGQGVFCTHEENKGQDFGYGVKPNGMPLLPIGEDFLCEKHKEKV